jgi:RING finger protein 113A
VRPSLFSSLLFHAPTLHTDLQGWQLDKLADAAPKDARDASDSDSDDEAIPFACLICRNAYTDPVVTRCGHYFCSACAIKRFAKTPKCAACLAPTGGIFNRADKVIEKRRKVKDKKRREGDEDEEAQPDGAGGAVQIEGLGGGNGSESEKSESDSDEDDD